LRPVERQQALDDLLLEFQKAKLDSMPWSNMSIDKFKSDFSMTQKEWDEHHKQVASLKG
jgi:hypothetical protein